MSPTRARGGVFAVKCWERDELKADANPYASRHCRIFRHPAESANLRTSYSLRAPFDKDLEKAMRVKDWTLQFLPRHPQERGL